jgi:hypothetical protein
MEDKTKYTIELQKYNDIFLANLMLLLKLNINYTKLENYSNFVMQCKLEENITLLIKNFELQKNSGLSENEYKKLIVNNTSEKVSDNLVELQNRSNNFLKSLLDGKELDISNLIKKIFKVVSNNYKLLLEKNPKLFQVKNLNKETNKEITVTVIPGLDLIYSWYCLNNSNKNDFWFYIENMFIAGAKMIYIVNKSSNNEYLKEINYNKLKNIFLTEFPEQNVINVLNLDIDPFLGVNNLNNTEFSVENIVNETNDLQNANNTTPGLSSMAHMLGIDKMLNLDNLSEQLKNINKTEIDDATANIKSLLCNNSNDKTSNMIDDIVTNIAEELQNSDFSEGNPINNIIKIAEKIGQNFIPKVESENINMEQLLQKTNTLANNFKDNSGNPIKIDNNMNPFNLLSTLMQNKNPKDLEALTKNMMNNLNNKIKK